MTDIPTVRTPDDLYPDCMSHAETVAAAIKLAYRRGHHDATSGRSAEIVGDVGGMPFYDHCALMWLREHYGDVDRLISAEPYWDDLEGAEQVEITYSSAGSPRMAVLRGEWLDDFRRYLDDADWPVQH